MMDWAESTNLILFRCLSITVATTQSEYTYNELEREIHVLSSLEMICHNES